MWLHESAEVSTSKRWGILKYPPIPKPMSPTLAGSPCTSSKPRREVGNWFSTLPRKFVWLLRVAVRCTVPPRFFSSGDETVRKVQKEDNSAAVLSAEGDSGAGKMYSSVKIVEVRKSRVGRMFKARHLYSGCGRRRWMDQWRYWKCSAAILHLVREKTGTWICDTNL